MATIGLVLLSFFFVSNATAQDKANLDTLIAKIDEVRQEYNVPAVGLTIIKQGNVAWQGSLGVANLDSQKPADENTFYRVGSITKAFTAIALLKLQEENKLKLSDHLKDYVSTEYFQNPWADEAPITVEQLLEHTAGFTDIGSAEFGHEDPNPIKLLDGLAFNGEHHLIQWKPGLHSSYSNLGTGLAGAVIEKVTGQNFDDYLSKNVLSPLGMHFSSTLLTPHLENVLATGYDSSGEDKIDYWHILLRPFGALNSSPKEMGNFIKLLVNRGQINGQQFLTESSIKRMESPQTTLAARAGLDFGYGFGNYHIEHKGFSFHGHGGTAAGYLARFDYLLENKSGYAVMINSNNNSALAAINSLIRDYLILGLNEANVEGHALNKDVSDYLGYYQPVTSRSRVGKFITRFIGLKKLTRENDQLKLSSLFSEPTILVHQGNHFYRVRGYELADSALIKTESGEIFLQNDSNYQKISSTSFYTQISIMIITIGLMLFGLIYFVWVFIRQLVKRKLPVKSQWLTLLRISPFVLFAGLFVLLIFFSPSKSSISASLFSAFGISILIISIISLLLAVKAFFTCEHKLVTKITHITIALVSVTLGNYLYYWDLISQPIWS
jgi:CubicO group peptidase (beta-lactamase class C family)